jgi:hypothetical protein
MKLAAHHLGAVDTCFTFCTTAERSGRRGSVATAELSSSRGVVKVAVLYILGGWSLD